MLFSLLLYVALAGQITADPSAPPDADPPAETFWSAAPAASPWTACEAEPVV